MILTNPNNYNLINFRKSKTKNKKYDAILMDKKTNKLKYVPFGDDRYGQYRDTTGLNIYSNKDTMDIKRREF